MLNLEARSEQIQCKGVKGSESFRLEYDPQTPEKRIRNDVVSYLGEYRFQVPKYSYRLFYTAGEDGLHLRGEEQGTSLLEAGKKGIEDKKKRGEITKKVVADYLGMQQMEEMVAQAKDGDTIMYASPADPEVGYTYGFFYIGQVVGHGQEKHLEMSAIRLESNQDLEKYNTALKLLTGENPQFATVNEFIAHPTIVERQISQSEIDFVMKGVFDFAMDIKQQQQFANIITRMESYVDEFVYLVQTGVSSTILEKAFHALENYALQLQKTSIVDRPLRREKYEEEELKHQPDLRMLMHSYGYEPPKVTGSCGSSSNSTFSSGWGGDIYGAGSLFGGQIQKDFVTKLLEQTKDEGGFKCPSCHIGWVKGNRCPYCKITAQEWAEKNPDKACV